MASEKAANRFNDGKRHWIYAARVKGKFQKLHRLSGIVLKAILFITPWLTLSGSPMLRVDIPGRRLYVLGAIFGATDTIFLLLMGLFAAFLLFFITSLYGRLWCGYLCPQTVFLEEWVRRIETVIEGDRGKRRARDNGPWTVDKAWRKAAKWSSFLVLAGVISMTTVSYFSGARPLWTGQASAASYGFVAVFSAVLFADFAWFREQFCNFLCPYARFQGALADDHSLTVAYNVTLGEPRKKGKRKTPEQTADFGACIDCNKCVSVCPTGIDIREGFQLECINCGRCVDACTGVMGKMEQESLITYTSVAEIEGKERKLVRPRTVAYATLLTVIALVFAGMLVNRHQLDVALNRAPGPLYQLTEDGGVRNTFMANLTNHNTSAETSTVTVTVSGLEGAVLSVGAVTLAVDESRMVPLVVTVPGADTLPRTAPMTMHFTTEDETVELETIFKSGEAMGTPSGS